MGGPSCFGIQAHFSFINIPVLHKMLNVDVRAGHTPPTINAHSPAKYKRAQPITGMPAG